MSYSNKKTFTELIKEKALSSGFCSVGIARVEKLNSEKMYLEEWLRRGYQASMGWMEKNVDKRADPGLILNSAQSIITVAINYWNENNAPYDCRTGLISRYAWGCDYHKVVYEKMASLLQWMKEKISEIEGKIYVDTGPVMEKVWAMKSGIGWIGKNTNLIIKKKGSFVFLGVILVNIELDYDESAQDHCGSCTACIDACPTGALSPYVLDSTKCISYWTIEHRNEIPDDVSVRFGNRIFGCDVCQEVCPWNRFAESTQIREFQPYNGIQTTELSKWAQLSEQSFNSMFRNSAVARAKYSGFLRNVRNALKNEKQDDEL